MARLVRKNYPQLGEVNAPYVHAVAHQGTLYISGLTAFGSEAQSGDVIAQASEIFRQLKVIATAEGVTLDNLIKVTIFVTSIGSLKALRQVLYGFVE